MTAALGGLCCWLAFGIVPDLRSVQRELRAERTALEGTAAQRTNSDVIARDCQRTITLQQAQAIQQLDTMRRTIEDMTRTLTRKE